MTALQPNNVSNVPSDPHTVQDVVNVLFGVGVPAMTTPMNATESILVVQNGAVKQVNPILLTIATPRVEWGVGASPDQKIMWIAPRPCKVISVLGRLEIAEGSAATVSVRKVVDGAALATGTIVTTAPFNANSTAATAQSLTLAASSATLTMAAGDVLAIASTGVGTNSSGMIQVSIEPLS